ncbi:MAG: hypothetical protein LBJ59_00615, partial [Zoogloeaceae bacterium]|nr:hypothetical protein [Zoogloeaceae bacterium]
SGFAIDRRRTDGLDAPRKRTRIRQTSRPLPSRALFPNPAGRGDASTVAAAVADTQLIQIGRFYQFFKRFCN